MSNSLSFKEKEHWKERISNRIDKHLASLCEKEGFLDSVRSKALKQALAAAGATGLQSVLDKIARDQSELEKATEKLRSDVEKKQAAIDRKVDPKIEALDLQIEQLQSQVHSLQKERSRKKVLVDEKLNPSFVANDERSNKLDSQKANTIRKMLATIRNVPVREVRESECYGQSEVTQELSDRQAAEVDEILATTDRGKQILSLREEKENLLDTVWLATSGKQIKDLWKEVVDLLGDKQTKLQQDAQALEPVEAE